MNLTRRDMLKLGGGAAATLMAGAQPLAALAMAKDDHKKIPIGLQLYSVRHDCEKDLPGVLEAVAKMGFEGVEFAGYYGRTAQQLRKLLDKNGLKCCGTHIKLPNLQGDELNATIEFNQILGNKYLIVAWMPHKYMDSVQSVKEMGQVYNQIAAKIKDKGMFVGYHAHAGDFKRVGGQFAWDLFFANTNKDVVMQLDLGNCVEGGGDPMATLKKFPGKSKTIHLKETGGPATAVIGEGDVNWKEVFKICESTGGTQWYIVEHERPAGTPLGNVKRCLQNLKKMGI